MHYRFCSTSISMTERPNRGVQAIRLAAVVSLAGGASGCMWCMTARGHLLLWACSCWHRFLCIFTDQTIGSFRAVLCGLCVVV